MIGIGLRAHHYPALHQSSHIPLLEVLSCNYVFHKGGPALAHLDRLSERTKMLMHGVSLDIGGYEELHSDYILELQKLSRRIGARIISDHLCFSRGPSHNSYDLLPVLKTESNLNRIVERIDQVQNILGRTLALENISTYVTYAADEYREIAFLAEICRRSGCRALLDINNAFVCGVNHGYDPWLDIINLRCEDIVQYHIAGHEVGESCLIDTHAETICEDVWQLLSRTIEHFGWRYLIVERDDDASLESVLSESEEAAKNLLM